MNDLTLILIYSVAVLSTLSIIGIALFKDGKKRLTPYILFFSTMVLGWQVVQLFYFSSRSFEWARFLFDIDLPFVALSAMATLIFTMRLFSLHVSRPVTLLLCVIPGITTLMAFAYNYTDYMRVNLEILSTWPMHTATFSRGPWFWVHAAYCYFVVALAFGIALAQYRRVPKVYRLASQQLLLSILISIAGNVLVLSGAFATELDFSLIAATISIYPFYFSTRNNQGLEFLHNAKEGIFNDIEEGILIIDDTDTVIDRNRAAATLLEIAGIDPTITSYSELQASLADHADYHAQIEKEGGGRDYYFSPNGHRLVLNVQTKDVCDKQNRRIASFVICSDVTENRARIMQLETEAGIDALTGIMNRHSMERAKLILDQSENLPLSIIVGDLDYLKRVNDTMGHLQGDIYLRVAAEILTSACPPNARIARIGGDEFLILIPKFDAQQARALSCDIRLRFQALTDYPFDVSMSIGTATKTQGSQSLSEVIWTADTSMYADKNQRRVVRV